MILPSKVIIKNKTEKKLLELKHVFMALIVVMSSWVCITSNLIKLYTFNIQNFACH